MKKFILFILLTFTHAVGYAETYIDAEVLHADIKELIDKDKMIDPDSFVMCARRDIVKFAYIGASPDGMSFNKIKGGLQHKYEKYGAVIEIIQIWLFPDRKGWGMMDLEFKVPATVVFNNLSNMEVCEYDRPGR